MCFERMSETKHTDFRFTGDVIVKNEFGETICFKSGEKKGQPKPFCAAALSSLFIEKYNLNEIRVLSVKNNMNTNVEFKVDIIIFTSSTGIEIDEFIYKYPKIDLSNPVKVFRIYCNNTIEYDKINSRNLKSNIKIIEDEKSIEICDETGDIIL